MDETGEDSDVGKEALFIENMKTDQDSEPLEQERGREYSDSDQDLEFTTEGDGSPSASPIPDEIKLKIEKVLLEFRCRVEDAILGNYIIGNSNKKLPKEKFKAKQYLRDITLWGVPLLPSKGHEGTDIILMKFLKAKDYKVEDAFDMLRKTMKWRKENKIDGILNEDLGSDFENVIYLNSTDREGRPVFYTDYGAFKDKQLYRRTFDTEEKYQQFLRWRIRLMEEGITKLKLKEGGVHSMIQIIDLKNAPRQGMKELNSSTKKALVLIQNNYPEIIYRHVVVNAPFWFYTSHVLLSRLLSQRSKRKFILARPAQATGRLLKFIAPEHLPVEYGGLERDKDEDFTTDDKAKELIIRGNAVGSVELPVEEVGVTVTWDVTVMGWEVSYKEEFIPDDECSYRILLQNQNKIGDSSRNSFHITEPVRCKMHWCAGVAISRCTLEQNALRMPSYVNTAQLMYIQEGSGIYGVIFPGCPETFEEPPRGRFQDRHQKIRYFRQGDIIAVPPGVPHWFYNNGNSRVVIVALLDTNSYHNQLDHSKKILSCWEPTR
ncbi:hypothetical protein L6164_034410 [Bauhinia variegata]|uniref:Uncharacterized protein n=1 Tax=Bauhinia variegata TaxID=167791 RepID=A0ACB9KUT2_BAUVA|nr:hypothetical protein L6164_034410 [Bauhinia variegata]